MITQTFLHECFYYDASTGVLTWQARPQSHFTTKRAWSVTNRKMAGKVAGNINVDGYRKIYVDGTSHLAHRLVWVYVHGSVPDLFIDHIDGNRDNNRLSNLRQVDASGNSRNMKLRKGSISGVSGVWWRDDLKKWRAGVCLGKRKIYLGCFTDIADAISARKAAEREFGFHHLHGTPIGTCEAATSKRADREREVA